ncbi:M56 family metallopeptidase [Acetatifactor muris]|uniref:M56 family metallopeptidase n=1 Tax=Acetatifactor muris TaxID=879566 RepID=UPI0023F457AB|nr:M56 family metallopeptidase [Acetatifactor muris]
MIYLLLITFAGGMLFSSYLIWQKMFDNCLTEAMKYRALLLVLLDYLVPWVWLKRPYEMLFTVFSGGETVNHTGVKGISRVAACLAELPGANEGCRILGAGNRKWILLAGIVWGSGVIVLSAAKMVRYFYERKLIMALTGECNDDGLEKLVKESKEELGYKGRVKLLRIPGEKISLAMGVKAPAIILQETDTVREQNFILRHEMLHTVRRDALFMLFLELLSCLHWFNSLIYILRRNFAFVKETSCDEWVVRGCTKEECTTYAKLITDSLGRRRRNLMIGSELGKDYRHASRRVKLIMQRKEISWLRKCVAVGFFVLFLAADSLTALLYPAFFL